MLSLLVDPTTGLHRREIASAARFFRLITNGQNYQALSVGENLLTKVRLLLRISHRTGTRSISKEIPSTALMPPLDSLVVTGIFTYLIWNT